MSHRARLPAPAIALPPCHEREMAAHISGRKDRQMIEDGTYFVTQSNLKKLCYRSGVIEKEASKIYEIVNEFNLNKFLSKPEQTALSSLSEFLSKTEESLIELAKKFKTPDKSSSFLFISGPPRYHKNSECKTLTQNFTNFEIPVEIEQRGKAAIDQFREFAVANRKLLSEGREDVFIQRLKTHFKLTADIGKIQFENSGSASTPALTTHLTLTELAAYIITAAARIESIGETEDGARAFSSYRYAPVRRLTQPQKIGRYEMLVLERKRELISLVTEYIVRKSNRRGAVFSRALFEAYGFLPCGICCAAD